jgi:hypothetical protein
VCESVCTILPDKTKDPTKRLTALGRPNMNFEQPFRTENFTGSIIVDIEVKLLAITKRHIIKIYSYLDFM